MDMQDPMAMTLQLAPHGPPLGQKKGGYQRQRPWAAAEVGSDASTIDQLFHCLGRVTIANDLDSIQSLAGDRARGMGA